MSPMAISPIPLQGMTFYKTIQDRKDFSGQDKPLTTYPFIHLYPVIPGEFNQNLGGGNPHSQLPFPF